MVAVNVTVPTIRGLPPVLLATVTRHKASLLLQWAQALALYV